MFFRKITPLSNSRIPPLHMQLHDNPFHCDCRLLDFSHWVSNSGIPRTLEPVCHLPARLSNRTLISLDLSKDLACLPQVEAFFFERMDPQVYVV